MKRKEGRERKRKEEKGRERKEEKGRERKRGKINYMNLWWAKPTKTNID